MRENYRGQRKLPEAISKEIVFVENGIKDQSSLNLLKPKLNELRDLQAEARQEASNSLSPEKTFTEHLAGLERLIAIKDKVQPFIIDRLNDALEAEYRSHIKPEVFRTFLGTKTLQELSAYDDLLAHNPADFMNELRTNGGLVAHLATSETNALTSDEKRLELELDARRTLPGLTDDQQSLVKHHIDSLQPFSRIQFLIDTEKHSGDDLLKHIADQRRNEMIDLLCANKNNLPIQSLHQYDDDAFRHLSIDYVATLNDAQIHQLIPMRNNVGTLLSTIQPTLNQFVTTRIDGLKARLTDELDQAFRQNVHRAVLRQFFESQPHHRIENISQIYRREATHLLDCEEVQRGVVTHLNNFTDDQILTAQARRNIRARKVEQRQENGERKMVHIHIDSLAPGDKAVFLARTEGLNTFEVLELIHKTQPKDEKQVKTWREHNLVERFQNINNDRELPLRLFPQSKERRHVSITARSIFKEGNVQGLLTWQKRTDDDFLIAIALAVHHRQIQGQRRQTKPVRSSAWRR